MRAHLLATTATVALLAATSAHASRIFQEQPCRRTNGSRPYGLPLPKRPRLRSTAVLASAVLSLAARIAIPVIILNGVSGVAFAQNATWVGTTSDWNTPGNWNPNVVPTVTATFNPSSQTSITFSAPSTTVQNLTFTAPGYTLNVQDALTINGSGVTASLANAPTFNVTAPQLVFAGSSTAGPAILNAFNTGPIAFEGNSNAGSATIHAGLASSTSITDPNGFTGGFVFFRGTSTAADAKITSFWASNIEFQDTSKAGNATITAPKNGGSIFFENASSADHATISILDRTGELSFAPAFFGGPGGRATAGFANITNDGITNFFQNSSAGNATITTNAGGVTRFFGNSTGGNAMFITNAGGQVDISGLGFFPDGAPSPGSVPMTAGSIEGAGSYLLGSKTLIVGSNNLSTTVSGTISDGGNQGGTGGSLVKVGTGTLTLSGANTYTGLTTISTGAINLTGSLLSPVSVEQSGTLGSTGTVFNTVTNAGTVAPGLGLPATQFGTLTVNNYVGASGTLALRTFLGGDGSPSDQLAITNGGTATGSTSVRITNVGGPGAETTSNGILVVNAINGATTAPGAFMLAPGELRAGAFDYRLFQGGLNGSDPNNWFLRSSFIVPPVPPGPVDPIGPSPPPSVLPPGVWPIIGPELATDGVVQPIARQMGLQTLGTLHQRIGDTLTLANTGGEGAGVGRSDWARFFGQGIDNRYDAFADPRASGWTGGFQGGVDLWRGSFLPGHRDAAGIYGAFANSNITVDGLVTNAAATGYVQTRTGTLGLNGYSTGGYWTHYGPSGWYLDAVLQGTYYNGNAITQFANLPINGSGFISSLEGGYPIPLPLGPRFVLEPQAQIIWQQVSFTQANDGLGPVGLGTTSGPTGRVGLRGMWTIDGYNGQVWQPYVRANLWRDWGAEATTLFGIDPVPLIEEATRLEFAGGVTALLGRGVSLYAQAGYQFAVDNVFTRNGVQGDIGLRYVW